jgi:DNA processing protein
MDSKAYWVGFNHVKGIGAVRMKALLDYFGSLEIAWQAPAEAMLSAGLSAKVVENLAQTRQRLQLETIWKTLEKQKIQVITWEDEEYPRRLKEIEQPPPVLYLRGSLTAEDEWAVAIVGTRLITHYGRQITEKLASFLAENHVTVVSGMARGVDGVAHDMAMKSGGRTLAVLGCGVDVVYPPEHQKLSERIIEQGAIISDYPPGTRPESINFPPRNRIISGLSQGVVVIEAGETSGALITAKFAAEQGREVFAVPGSIAAPQSKGTNRLIQDGARPMLRCEDVLEALQISQVHEFQSARRVLPADEVETRLLQVLGDEPLHIDEVCNQVGFPIDKISAALAMMELKGMVRQSGGMNFVIIRDELAKYRTEIND